MNARTLMYLAAVGAAGFALWKLYQAVTPEARGGAFATPPAFPVQAADTALAVADWDDVTARKADEALTGHAGIWGNLP